jgi:peptidyl-prolyl cis-trans isomerase SurA
VGLRTYWAANRDSFRAGERVAALEYRSTDSLQLVRVDSLIRAGYTEAGIDTMLRVLRLASVRASRTVLAKGSGELATALYSLQVGQSTQPRRESNRLAIYRVIEFRQVGSKTFEEARAEAITKYQEHLEREWLRELEQTYPYRLNEKQFKKLFKS